MDLFTFLILLIVSIWVYRDAISRGYASGAALLWSIGVFALLIIFLPIYLIARKPKRSVTDFHNPNYADGPVKVGQSSTVDQSLFCSHCGSEVSSNYAHCPYCGGKLNSQEIECSNCQGKMEEDWRVCPRCGAEQNR